jgi:hypothetical protein
MEKTALAAGSSPPTNPYLFAQQKNQASEAWLQDPPNQCYLKACGDPSSYLLKVKTPGAGQTPGPSSQGCHITNTVKCLLPGFQTWVRQHTILVTVLSKEESLLGPS